MTLSSINAASANDETALRRMIKQQLPFYDYEANLREMIMQDILPFRGHGYNLPTTFHPWSELPVELKVKVLEQVIYDPDTTKWMSKDPSLPYNSSGDTWEWWKIIGPLLHTSCDKTNLTRSVSVDKLFVPLLPYLPQFNLLTWTLS